MAERYLLVGYPGLVAQAVLRLFEQTRPEAEIDVLVETPSQAERVRREHAAAVRVHLGRRSSVDLGLSGRRYMELAGGLRRVLWCPDLVGDNSLTLEESPLVRGAVECVELLRAAPQLEGAVFLSSIFALGSATGRVLESDLRCGQLFSRRMEEACAVAENIVERAARDLPVTIARAAAVLGDAETGECAMDGALLRLVRACEAGPRMILASFRNEPVHLVGADYVARALLTLVHEPGARRRRVHLVEEAPPTDAEFFHWVATACERSVEQRPVQGRRARPQSPLMRLDNPEARALQGWAVTWDRAEARTWLPGLVSQPLEQSVPRLVAWCRRVHDR